MHAVILPAVPDARHPTGKDRLVSAPLLRVGGSPLVVRQTRMLAREGITGVTLLAEDAGVDLRAVLADEARALNIEFGELSGLAGEVLIVHGDLLFDLTLAPLREFHRTKSALITVLAQPSEHPRVSDLLAERNGLATAILSRNALRDGDHRNIAPAGVYLAGPEFFRRVPAARLSNMIGDVLPALIAAGHKVGVFQTPEYLRRIAAPSDLAKAEREIAAGWPKALNTRHKRPAIFFDVDGVLNHEPGGQGVLKPDDLILIDGAGEALRRTRDAGHLAIAITNRAQVARGLITFDDLDRIFGRLEALLAQSGGILDRIYFCPHHPDPGPSAVPELSIACECRKPGTLLYRQAIADLPVDVPRSASIGDSLRDIGAARGVGLWAYGVRTGYGCRDVDRYPGGAPAAPAPHLMFADVGEAVRYNLSYRALAAPVLQALRNLPSLPRPLIVAVAGRSRSGKSAVAHAVTRALTEDGTPCLHVQLDDWIMPAEQRTPSTDAEARSRVDALPAIVTALREGKQVIAPGYDAQTRGEGRPKLYDPAGCRIIVLDGLFAAHASVRELIDLAMFVKPLTEPDYKARFRDLYRWKGFDDEAIEKQWLARTTDEWPLIDAQRDRADLIVPGMAAESPAGSATLAPI